MASLTNCLKKFGKNISQEDVDAIRARVSELNGDFVAAAGEVLSEAQDERAQLIKDINKKAGVSDTQAVKQPNQEYDTKKLPPSAFPKQIEIDGVSRPTTNSDGRPIHTTLEGVRNFWKWFVDSKVVNENGEPLVVYHGSGKDIEEFNGTTFGAVTPDLANEYAEMRARFDGQPSNVIPAYMAISNPFNADSLPKTLTVGSFVEEIINQTKENKSAIDEINSLSQAVKRGARKEESGPHYSRQDFWYKTRERFGQDGADAIQKIYELAGFDGIKNTELGSLTYGAFRSQQVKSAIGNRGTFNAKDSSIVNQPRQAYNPDQLEFNYETDPEKQSPADTRAKEEAQADVAAYIRRRKGSILANAISKDFTETGTASLVGRKVENPAELADLAEIYRNPKFETFRVFFMKGNEIVGQNAITSRLPGSVKLFESEEHEAAQYITFKKQMDNVGADGYYMLHNHPSGDPRPSREDIGITKRFSWGVSGLLGHVVINGDKFAVMDVYGRDSIEDRKPSGNTYIIGKNPIKNYPLIGTKIASPDKLASIGASLRDEAPNQIQIIGISGKAGINGIISIDPSTISQRPNAKDKIKLLAELRRFSRQVGSGQLFAVNVPREFTDLFSEAIRAGFITDATITGMDKTLAELNQIPGGRGFTGRAMRIEEEKGKYQSSEGENERISTVRPVRNFIRDQLDAIRFQMQDKLIDLKRAQEDINPEDDANAYQKAATWEGKAGKRLNDFDERYVQPILEKVAESGLSIDAVGEWLVARHAEEANAYLEEINPDKPPAERGRLSGMSNDEATAILAEHQDNAALQQVGNAVDMLNRQRVRLLVKEGLITQKMADLWQDRYEHYVPLKREEAEASEFLPPRGQGFNIKGKESKMRTGSAYWTPSHILANTIAQAEVSIVRAEKNKVGKALLKFVEENPNPDFWEIITEKTVKYVRKAKVESVDLPLFSMTEEILVSPPKVVERTIESDSFQDAPNELSVKRDGIRHVIEFKTSNERAVRLAKGLKNLQAAEMGTVVKALSSVTRFLSTINTTWNPEFVISNFTRDIQTALYNLSDTEIADMKMRVFKDVAPAMNGIRSALFGDGKAEWAPIWNEFEKHGGKTGWIDLHNDILKKERDLVKIVERLKKGKNAKSNWARFLKGVDSMNSVVENSIRLSAYKNARDAGLSPDRAAALAKDLTVNFNRKGAMGPTMNAFYMFYNAGVQGNVRLMQALAHSKQARRLAIATVGFAMFLDMINRSNSGNDDDGENLYDELPDFLKDHNIIIMGEKEPAIKIPAPWGYNVLHTLGQVIGEAMTGERFKAIDSAARVGNSIIDAFNPMGSGTFLQTIFPTITDPIAMVAENKTFMGTPLKPEHTMDAFAPKPEYQMHWKSAREISKYTAEKLNTISGGNEIRPGKINISPEWIDLIFDTVFGGLGRTAANTQEFLSNLIQGKESKTENIPFVRKVTGFDSDYGIKSRYYEWSKGVVYAKAELKAGVAPDPNLKSLIGTYNIVDKQIKRLRKIHKSLLAKNAPQEKLDENDEKIRMLMARFNKAYAERMLNTED